KPEFELPNYVAVGNGPGPGYLGPKYAPLVVNDFERGLPDLSAPANVADADGRASLVEELDRAFLNDYQANSTRAHQANMQRAAQKSRTGRSTPATSWPRSARHWASIPPKTTWPAAAGRCTRSRRAPSRWLKCSNDGEPPD